ncbi:TonB-linked outer membrane protein, SusC/RagA family [Pedobacter westerhofensis]|uniref:TonB-linked outer membrane protein, SusC/RagA family n=2 Tax=Pedobacter westerhofensis TaxID=425512 RepID=A0A521ESU3_9SPHI|nr:TonB-linked outer membrane protein, SusC/RagA family [Pedobacter westerhofensis]
MKFFKHPKMGVMEKYWLLKSLLIMKLTTLLIILFNLNVVASGFSQTKVTLNMKSADFKKVISSIQKQSDYHFIYSESNLPTIRRIDINVQNAEVPGVIANLLANSGFKFSELPNHLIVISATGTEMAVVKFTGKVVDEKGQPLPGATVRIKGAKTGASTDTNGFFTLDAPDNSILTVSYIGYNDKDVTASGSAPLLIALVPEAKSLTEVVVVGYGTQKKVNLTGAIATVSADKLDSRPMVNLGDGLQGLIPNLNVNLNSGQPGQGASFNIRGLTTLAPGSTDLTTTSPLILVDGVARDPNLIDPNDVESVTVLKDAASASIYGSRAANGVMLITTKSGKKGPTRVTYSGSYTISRPTQLADQVNSGDYIKMFNYANRSGQQSGGYTTDPFTARDSTLAAAYRADPANNPTGYPDPGNPKKYRYVGNTDWVKELYPGWAPQQQHNVSVSGGEEKTTYAAGMGYFKQEGLQESAKQVYQRYTPSLKVNTDVNKWLTFNFNMSLTHIDNDQPAATRINQGGPGNGSWLTAGLPPTMPIFNPDGNGHYAGQGNYTNPMAVNALSGRDIDNQNDFWTTGRIIVKPVDHLSVVADYTFNTFSEFEKANMIPYNEYGVDGQFLSVFPWTNPSQVSENRQNNTYKSLNTYATYENTFAGKHYVKALVGYNQEYYHYRLSNATARNLIDPTLPAIGINTDTKPVVGGVETESALIGSFSRLNYIYDNRYLIEVNARYDGSSRFPANDKYVFSPSVSLGWNIANEAFMKNIKNTVNELKIRASYGQLPDQLTPGRTRSVQDRNGAMPGAISYGNISSYAQYPYIPTQLTGTVPYLIGGQPGTTVRAPTLLSSNQTWEKVQTKNIGLDFAFLNDKLNGSFDYFINNTKDILVNSLQLPAVLGAATPPSNSADLRSKGWELSLNWKDKALDGDLHYAVTLSLSNNSNTKVTRYAGNPTNNLGDFRVGQELGEVWGYTNNGYYKTDAEAQAVDNSALAGYKWLAGDIKYADLNGDGKINYGNSTLANHGDLKVIGNQTPHNRFGLNLNASYKSWDFTTFFQGVLSHRFYPNEYTFYAFRDDEYSIPSTYSTDYWTPENPNAFFPRVRFSGGGNEQAQDKYLLNAAYARVKQITLGYTLPKVLTNKMKMQRLRVYVTGANLFTITSLNKNYDPEVVGFNTYPLNKSIAFGLQASL